MPPLLFNFIRKGKVPVFLTDEEKEGAKEVLGTIVFFAMLYVITVLFLV